MADVTGAPDGRPFRPDRVYLGWQYTLLNPNPGPRPKRPTPPEQEQLNPEWVAAQRREENLLNRPLKLVLGAAVAAGALFTALWITGLLAPLLAGLGVVICVFGAGISGYAIWQGEQALRARVLEEKQRLEKIRARQESRLFAWQEEHARRFREWEERRAAYEGQAQWYAVSLPGDIDRVDVAGGTLSGWSALSTVIGASRLATGGEVTVVDLSEGAAALDLVSIARRWGIGPAVWVLPTDLPRLELGTGLGKEELADLLSLVVSVSEEHASMRDLSYDNAILERVIDVFGGNATVAQITAALRTLAQVGDPREDLSRGLVDARQLARIETLFGRGAADQVVMERAWALESQLRKLESLGSAPAHVPATRLRVISTDRRAGVFGNRVLGTFAVTTLTHLLRRAPGGPPWQHEVLLLGAEKLRGDVLDRLCDACEATSAGLVLAYRSVPGHVAERLGRGNAAVAFMRLGNAEDAKVASEHIGTQHRFVLSQLTDTIGAAVTDTVGGSYVSTIGTATSSSVSTGTNASSGRHRGRGRSHESNLMPFGHGAHTRSEDTSYAHGTSSGESVTGAVSESTAWGVNTARAFGANSSSARRSQRSREFIVEQHELQHLPPSSVIITYTGKRGRRVVMADTNPAILTLPTATMLDLDEARIAPQGPQPPMEPPRQPPPGRHARPRPGEAGSPDGAGSPAVAGTREAAPRAAPAGVGAAHHEDGATGSGNGTESGAGRGGGAEPGGPAGGGDAAGNGPSRPRPGRGPGRRPEPVSWQGEDKPPPNLGPPPDRLDWRKKPRDSS
jgi:hypothetical protein